MRVNLITSASWNGRWLKQKTPVNDPVDTPDEEDFSISEPSPVEPVNIYTDRGKYREVGGTYSTFHKKA